MDGSRTYWSDPSRVEGVYCRGIRTKIISGLGDSGSDNDEVPPRFSVKIICLTKDY